MKHAVLILPDRSAAIIIIHSQVSISTAGLEHRRNDLVFSSSMRLILFMVPAVKDTMTKHVDEIVKHLLDNTDL